MRRFTRASFPFDSLEQSIPAKSRMNGPFVSEGDALTLVNTPEFMTSVRVREAPQVERSPFGCGEGGQISNGGWGKCDARSLGVNRMGEF